MHWPRPGRKLSPPYLLPGMDEPVMDEGDDRRVAQVLPGDTEASPGLLWGECRKEEDRMPQLMANPSQ